MTVLVTGGAGFIGGHTVLALVDRGEIPVVLDDLSTGSRAAVPGEVDLHVGDIADAELVTQLIRDYRVDAILHFAARIVVPDSVADPLGYYTANTLKTHALLRAAIAADVKRFIFSSSAAVYGNPDAVPVDETAQPNPLSPYGRSKLMSEQMLTDAGVAHGLRSVALRYFNVAGADPYGRHGQSAPGATHLIKVAIETALGQRPHMNIYGTDYETQDGTCVRDYVHVGSGPGAFVRARSSARGWRLEDPQLRLWPGLFGSRGRARGPRDRRDGFRGPLCATASRRSGCGGGRQQRACQARLETRTERSVDDDRACLSLGRKPGGEAAIPPRRPRTDDRASGRGDITKRRIRFRPDPSFSLWLMRALLVRALVTYSAMLAAGPSIR
jgi:UDP-glucose-4-epimerase GalE